VLAILTEDTDRALAEQERAASEAALEESEARYRAFVTASSDVVYRMGPDWSEMRRLDGRGFVSDTAEPTGGWMERYIHPDDRRAVRDAIEEAVGTKGIFELEHRVLRVDGTLGWTLSRAVPNLGRGGEVLEWLGTARDVTARKEAEGALREGEERQAYLLELNDALRPLTDPVELQAVAARVLGEHLGADRAYYVEIDEENGKFVVARDWHRPGAPSHARRYPLEDWPMPWFVDGETWVVCDVDSDPAMPDEQRESYRGNGIGAEGRAPLAPEPAPVQQYEPPAPVPAVPAPPAAPAVGGDLDCKDFGSLAEVQQSIAAGDPHGLDADGDGSGCESQF
jgi:hypothetical protein